MRIRLTVSSVACAILLASCQQPPATADQAAQRALIEFRALVTPATFRDLGFEGLGDVQRAQLGPPLRVFVIGLDAMRRFTPGSDARSLLTPAPEIIYPVTVNGTVRSAITVAPGRQGYASASFGEADLMQELSAYRSPQAGAADSVVQFPALGLYFLGREQAGRLYLVPVGVEPRLQNLRIGVAAPAEEILAQVVPLAQAHNGQPG